MNPTLKNLDILQVIPYNDRKIQIGDVIVFLPLDETRKVTHRVVSVNLQGIRTRGDNNKNIDSQVLIADNIVGQVVYAQRGNKQLRIYGGIRGQLFALTIRAIHVIGSKIDSVIITLLRPTYYWLARSGIFRKWLPIKVKTRIISFNRSAGTELQLLMGRRVIGSRPAGSNQWHIRRPFLFFVDETFLLNNKLL